MQPVKTENTNAILKAPNQGTNVVDLPITRLEFNEGTPAVESCWELSREELEIVNRTGKVYFVCMGNTHPPILLSAESLVE